MSKYLETHLRIIRKFAFDRLLEQSLRKEKEVAEEIIKEENDIEKVIESERQSLEPVDDDMDETVETADEYALEPADSKKASAVSMSASERLGVELKKFEEARVNDIYFTSKYQRLIFT